MNNIYAQKAKKYKYKYLQLKNEYNAVGGNYLGEGAYGCIISPPYNFDFKDNTQIIYQSPIDNIDNNIYNEKYVGKLLNCNAISMFGNEYINSFYDEYKELNDLNTIDPNANYRSKLVFAAYINDEQYKKIDTEYTNNRLIFNNHLLIFNKCLNNKINKKQTKLNDANEIKEKGKSYNLGYIISTKVGTSFDKIQLNKFNKKQIIQILTNLKESIQDLITTLYKQNLIHADIKFPNMTLDEKNDFKVCFIDFGLMRNITVKTDIEKLNNIYEYYLYPDILYIYFHIIKIKQNTRITKSELIRLFNLNKNLKQIFKKTKYNQTLLNKIKINNIDYSCFFESLDDYTNYPFNVIYIKCIEPIIKNIDIYGLSLFIYELFFNSEYNTNIFNQNEYIEQKKTIDAIINMLLINALYNNIDGPEELIIYLDGIINCLNNNYKLGYIKDKIYERRQKLEKEGIESKPYYNYYNDGYTKKWIKGIEEINSYKLENESTIKEQKIYDELLKKIIIYQEKAQIYQEEAQRYQKEAQRYQKEAQRYQKEALLIIKNSTVYI